MVNRDVLLDRLSREVVEIIFEKSDGTKRTMLSTLMDSYLPPPKTAEEPNEDIGSRTPSDPDHITVWSVGDNGWRSFKLSRVIHVG